jgi:hypothetical protein
MFDLANYQYIVIPGVITSITLMVVVSLLTKPSPPEKWAPFFTKGPVAGPVTEA